MAGWSGDDVETTSQNRADFSDRQNLFEKRFFGCGHIRSSCVPFVGAWQKLELAAQESRKLQNSSANNQK
eukprot:3301910-Amphidinium_carterae.1